ncbi:hypothetical protein BU24DRAFT_104599 [Aaosphaeria arxii CBS 175.79]|uniref:Uncharacterized protein n=1 Tax=Aaosphaeria arxii CBS 175.79 TaxID=1450172 RepID=A0A6A5Y109_9PLEO|nr:uncharacterized protein BU24DRAFT_104599 [Aaosphaeria arxii CBS 175.79]KAF2018757.1 hypothetical protein BU24DRAFT_104599 [Aaosphaeria arxii CBS 175.79]
MFKPRCYLRQIHFQERSRNPGKRCLHPINHLRYSSNTTEGVMKSSSRHVKPTDTKINATEKTPTKKKTQSELDKELELKMKGLAGDGGEAGVELEDGQPVSMKRSVRNNMFRYI